ncbi:MAG: site-2 protease family protein [Candidatus Aenigmarchaeota archaeon]|nr:site-2 protease family protein [Candidatus Aenigmarchaeota archaeon]
MFHYDPYSLSAAVFILILAILVYRDRKKFTRDGIILLRKTQKGKSGLIALGERHPTFFRHVGNLGVIMGFSASILMIVMLVKMTFKSLAEPSTGAIGLLLPSLSSSPSSSPGLIFVPFWYWIIIIALLAFVHEGMHGIIAARERIRIKSLGWGLLAVIPLAFVEPDEKEMRKKKHIQQLRVFAAGSLANFALAAIAILILSSFSGLYMQDGAAFITYPASEINVSSVKSIDGIPIDGRGIISVLSESGSNVEITAGAGIFYAAKENLMQQLNRSRERIIVFEPLPAANARLAGTIKSVNGKEIRNHTDLQQALTDAGVGSRIEVATTNGTFSLVTVWDRDYPFSPDSTTGILASLESAFPGTIDAYFSAARGSEETYRSLKGDTAFWKYIKDSYPSLHSRAGEKIGELDTKLKGYREPGIIGISGVHTAVVLRPSLAGYRSAIDFLEGLLLWLFLINLGVGAFNLLPVTILDGGRMWELVFMRISRRHYRNMVKGVSLVIGALIILNLVIPLKPF